MPDDTKHWRVVSEINGRFLIQAPHFKRVEDAREYIDQNANVIVPGECVRIVEDSDARIYPVWRANRPPSPSALTTTEG